MAYGTINADVIQSSVTGVSLGAGNATRFKNRIINGNMVIDQRNAGASVTATTAVPFTLDRWLVYSSPTSKFTVQQNAGSVTPPVGFTNYLGAVSSSAYSLGTSDIFVVNQNIEGFNTADLAWGTANAKTITLSFQVYSSLTGTFGGVLRNSADNRSYPFTYSIPTANTWTSISVTVAGDTSGTWLTTSGVGLRLSFGLGVGSSVSGTAGAWASTLYQGATGAVSVVGTSGATWYVTGVQLEVGSSATGFDFRDYGTELILCQRYYEKTYDQSQKPTTPTLSNLIFIGLGYLSVGTNVGASYSFKVTKRTDATVTIYSPGTGAAGYARNGAGGDIAVTVFAAGETGGSAYVAASAGGIDFSIQYVASAEL